MTQILFASDLHLGHRLAAEKRGFTDLDLHDEFIIHMLKGQCDKRTILYILGDVCMDIKKINQLRDIPGRKKLVRGNHDQFNMGVYANIFEEILGFCRYKGMWLSHCPMHPQEMYGRINVHGHIHKDTNSPLLNHPYYNVNWDFWGQGITLEKIQHDAKNYQESDKDPRWNHTPQL